MSSTSSSPTEGPTPKRPRVQPLAKRFIHHIEGAVNFNSKFKLLNAKATFAIENLPHNPESLLAHIFDQCVRDALEEARRQGVTPDRLGATISSDMLNPDIWIPVRPITRNTADAILNRFLEVAQSKTNEGSIWGAPFNISITIIDRPPPAEPQQVKGSGFRRPQFVHHIVKESALLPVRNKNNAYCLFYALEIARMYHTKERVGKNMTYYLHNMSARQERDAIALMQTVEIPLGRAEYDAAECVPRVVDFWNKRYAAEGHRFKVFIFGEYGHYRPKFKYGPEEFNLPISLYHHGGHFDAIRWSVGNAIFGRDYYCFACEAPFNNKDTHVSSCPARCLDCGRLGPVFPCKDDGFFGECLQCNKRFINQSCYEHHLRSNWCAKSKKCKKCGRTWNVANNTQNGRAGHDCKEKFCFYCKKHHDPKKGCFIQPIRRKKQQKQQQYRLIAFDCETTQCRQVANAGAPKRIHDVNFISAWVTCTECIRHNTWRQPLTSEMPCKICGPHRTVTFSHCGFENTPVGGKCVTQRPMHDFVNWLMANFDSRYPSVVFSHFGSRFDNIIAFREFFANGICPQMITKGNRLYEMRVPRTGVSPELIIRDSWNLMPVPLAALPKAFGLSDVQDKPFFPHLFNRPENYDFVLDGLPPKSDYIYGGMRPKTQRAFDAWYEQHSGEPFDLAEQLAAYCVNDTRILIEALIAFRTEFLAISSSPQAGTQTTSDLLNVHTAQDGIDITWDPLTLASAAMRHFRLNHLREEQLALVPERGYDRADTQSTLALKFLDWYEQAHGVRIQTAHTAGGEHRIGRYTVDGYIEDQDCVIEVNGCHWHCHEHPRHRSLNPNTLINGHSVAKIREDDAARLDFIRSKVRGGVKVFWECEINDMLRNDEAMRLCFNSYNDRGPIRLRECFHGGRVGPARLHYEVPEGWKMKLLDVRSLYPYTTATTAYPVGHPSRINVISRDEMRVDWRRPEDIPVRGILKVFVVPPRGLKVPVLPAKFENDPRLLFPLCRACALRHPEGARSTDYRCPHGDTERGWVTTVTSIELAEALAVGYRCTEYYRSIQWDDDKWDDKIFAGYVAEFMAMKYHASGFPAEVGEDPHLQERFIAECAERFGICIDLAKMKADDAKRIISKFFNNSLWGRFALRNGLSQTLVTDSPAELRRYLDDPKVEVDTVDELTPECVLITYTTIKEFVEEHNSSNIIMALWTTSAARIHLLHLMQAVARQTNCVLLYTDTDSVCFAYKESDGLPPELRTGPHLGDLSDEWPEHELLEFVSGGCKQYAFRMRNLATGEEQTILKVRGITLSADACELLHFETFKRSVLYYAGGGAVNGDAEEEIEEILIEYPNFIRPDLHKGTVFSVKLCKLYRPIVTKAIIGPHSVLIDFGFQ